MIYFEDVAPGDRASFGRDTLTREEVVAFASAYDPQPFHLSDEAAKGSIFGRLAASGWHTCAVTMRMMVDRMAAEPVASMGGAGVDALRWSRPVYPGDTLRCETEVLETRASRSRPEMGTVRQRVDVFNQDDALVLTFVATTLMGTRARKIGAV
jgi:acyl dehydratase